MALLQNVIQRGTHAARPAAGSAGVVYFESDTGQLFRDSGSAWQLIDLSALLATKGDLLVGTGSGTVAKLAAGADAYVLTADSAQTDGIKWAAATVGTPTWTWAAKTANYTITTSDYGVLADATSGALTITLPTAVGATQQYAIAKKDSSANKVTIATTSSQTIDGVSTKTLALQDDVLWLGSDGSNWRIAAQHLGDVVQLDYAASTDIASGVALTSSTWTDLGSNQTFSVDDANSDVELAVSGNALIGTTGAANASRAVLDSAGTPTNKMLGGNYTANTYYSNPLAGSSVVTLTGLATGSHTVKVQVYTNNSGSSLYCRALTQAAESLQIRVIERKR